ncbi:solute carrier family 46 member 3 [Trichinella spiralis]|uniref:solute carrier family 46 member 3 n=1 Tax=Trichinella spiralis TaxID=6334 RepID=UPI0001EFBB22|nr:solute carrier family 46 member 3 [Trichinella spiralis]
MSNSLRLPSQTLSTVLCCLFNGPSPSSRQSVFLTCSNESAGMTHRSSSLVLLCQYLRQLFSPPAPISTWFSSVSSRSTVLFIHWTFVFSPSLCIRWFVNVRLFSTIAMLEQLSPVLSTIVFNFLYAKLVTVYSGFVFMFSSAVKLIFFVIMGWIYWKTRIKSVQHTATVEVDKSDLIDEENNNSDTT